MKRLAVLLMWMLAGCSDSSGPIDAAGDYNLVSINGRGIPFDFVGPHFDVLPACTGEFFRGTATLSTSNQYDVHIHWLKRCGSALFLDTLRYYGGYAGAARVKVVVQPQNPSDGLFDITHITVQRDEVLIDANYFVDIPFTFRFERN